MSNTKATPMVIEALETFGKVFQLPPPAPEYIEAIQAELSANKWTLGQMRAALNYLKYDPEYNRAAKYNKYPTICDYNRADFALKHPL